MTKTHKTHKTFTEAAMQSMLGGYGERFTGDNPAAAAAEWLDHGFGVVATARWCNVGVWDAATAARFRDAGLSPEQVADAADKLVAHLDDERRADPVYADPVYAVCNGDLPVRHIIDAAKS